MRELPMCGGKRAYDKKSAITAKNRRFKEDHIPLRVYECPGRGHWHLTHLDPFRGDNKPRQWKRKKK